MVVASLAMILPGSSKLSERLEGVTTKPSTFIFEDMAGFADSAAFLSSLPQENKPVTKISAVVMHTCFKNDCLLTKLFFLSIVRLNIRIDRL
jgi:hypothetical protein